MSLQSTTNANFLNSYIVISLSHSKAYCIHFILICTVCNVQWIQWLTYGFFIWLHLENILSSLHKMPPCVWFQLHTEHSSRSTLCCSLQTNTSLPIHNQINYCIDMSIMELLYFWTIMSYYRQNKYLFVSNTLFVPSQITYSNLDASLYEFLRSALKLRAREAILLQNKYYTTQCL